MSPVRRQFRLVVQRIGDHRGQKFRIVAYGSDTSSARAEFASLLELLEALESAALELVLDLGAEGSIIFSGGIEMDNSQLKSLKLA
jgi:hypothetical protein